MKRNKVLAMVLALAMVVSLLPATAFADGVAELDISNGDITITETGYTQGNGTETPHTVSYKITQTGTASVGNKIIIESGEIDLTISGLNIEAEKGPAIKVGNGAKLNLTLEGENTLTGADGYAAVSVAAGEWDNNNGSYVDGTQGHLLINGSGSLTAQGGDATTAKLSDGGAGSGGDVITNNSQSAAGAGIGGDGNMVLKVTGNNVEGNTDGGNFGIIEINGGTIKAIGGKAIRKSDYTSLAGAGAGIGGGGCGFTKPGYEWHYTGQIIINGGIIEAVGGEAVEEFCSAAAGIGSGAADSSNATYGTDLSIKITGGKVTATGGVDAAGIGGSTNGACGTIEITGGEITAVGGDEGADVFGGAGIGGGNNGGGEAIIISGNAIVNATGGGGAAGIGGGYLGSVNEITIEGDAQVTASGDYIGGAGIGAGYMPYVGRVEKNINILINIRDNAQVTANGVDYAGGAGIGAGYMSTGNAPLNADININIEDNAQVTAIGGGNNSFGGAGIGAGHISSTADVSVDMQVNIDTSSLVIAYAGTGAQAIGEPRNVGIGEFKSIINIGENTGSVWAFNRDNAKSALYGIEMDNAIDDEKLTLNSHGLYWYNGDGSNQAYYWDTSKDAADNSIFTWECANNLSIFNKSQQSIAAQEYDSNYFAGSGNWALIATAEKSGSGGSGTVQIHTLHYETNGGEKIASESQNGTWAKLFNTLPTPKRDGYDFAGWYFDCDLSKKVTDSFSVDLINVTIYAKWTKLITDPDDNGVADILDSRNHIAYLNGYEDGSFAADKIMTRAEVAAVFYNLLLNKDVPQTVYFADVTNGDWYAEAVNTLASLGIVKGIGENLYAPNKPITRAEFTAIAMRFGQLESGGENVFSDVKSDDWYYDAVVGSVKYGWISGYSDGTFRPNAYITRAEVTSIVNRMLNRQADKQYIDNNRSNIRQFYDLSANYWAYYEIMEAVNAHQYTLSPTETWAEVNNLK